MKKLLFFLTFFGSLNVSSQETTTASQFSVNLLAPSAEYELAVAGRSTIDMNLGVGFAYHNSSYGGEAFGLFPGIEAQYRYYYNFGKRVDKGKKTSENSANYIAGVASITSGKPIIGDLEYTDDFAGFVGPAWGLQRVYNSGFKLNLNLGLGMGFNEGGNAYLTPLFGLQLGWKLGK
ncbi:hypothetical protein [Christiangramia echinicola]|uniref:Outer membrane protein beta-barrel domain-containing protein n=1 Tax=Christiangramia echinicola TaxID=279359 RepID=A0A1H1P831_9FLAO|nr:hypothetical protein [Christiangramia echinicola]SDS06779.1 hypothetical protein SAMN04488552_1997 [Christiangramia echinicola]